MRTRRILLVGVFVLLAVAGTAAAGALAERRALEAEEAHVADRLEGASCLSEWGVDEGAATKRAAVTGVTARGVRVAVSLPYAHASETAEGSVHADSASDAVYVVSPWDARRVRGDRIDPC